MRRKLLAFSTAVSLLLCLALTATWVRSLWRHDYIYRQREIIANEREVRDNWTMYSGLGRLALSRLRIEDYYGLTAERLWRALVSKVQPHDETRWKWDANPVPPGFWQHSGNDSAFACSADVQGSLAQGREYRTVTLGAPHWAVVGVFAILPTARIIARLRRSRAPANICSSCGYDLRATPLRCPECGAVPGEKAAV